MLLLNCDNVMLKLFLGFILPISIFVVLLCHKEKKIGSIGKKENETALKNVKKKKLQPQQHTIITKATL